MLSAHRSYRRDWLPQSSLSSSSSQFPSRTIPFPNLAGAEGFEPPSPVLETGSLTVELTPLHVVSCQWQVAEHRPRNTSHYFTSLCGVCLRQRRQNFFSSNRSVIVFRFLVFE